VLRRGGATNIRVGPVDAIYNANPTAGTFQKSLAKRFGDFSKPMERPFGRLKERHFARINRRFGFGRLFAWRVLFFSANSS